MQEFSLELQQKTNLTADVVEFRFSKPEGFDFLAGQFVQIFIPHEEAMVKRSYSISSTPADPYIEFGIKILPDGIGTQYLNNLRQGDTITVRGPLGHFVSKDIDSPLCFVATGVGLSPIYGIIADELKHKGNRQHLHLYFGVRHEADIFWMDRLETLARDYDNFSYTLTLSRPSDTWDSAEGRVTAHMERHPETDHFYLCGSPDMVRDVREGLMSRGVDPTQIKFEIF